MNYLYLIISLIIFLANDTSATSISSDPADLLKRGSAFTKFLPQNKDSSTDPQFLIPSNTRQVFNQITMPPPLYQSTSITKEAPFAIESEPQMENHPRRINEILCCWTICGIRYLWGE